MRLVSAKSVSACLNHWIYSLIDYLWNFLGLSLSELLRLFFSAECFHLSYCVHQLWCGRLTFSFSYFQRPKLRDFVQDNSLRHLFDKPSWWPAITFRWFEAITSCLRMKYGLQTLDKHKKSYILIVCPAGLMIHKFFKFRLQRSFERLALLHLYLDRQFVCFVSCYLVLIKIWTTGAIKKLLWPCFAWLHEFEILSFLRLSVDISYFSDCLHLWRPASCFSFGIVCLQRFWTLITRRSNCSCR